MVHTNLWEMNIKLKQLINTMSTMTKKGLSKIIKAMLHKEEMVVVT